MVQWVVATPTVNSDKFEVEYSADGKNWNDYRNIKDQQYQPGKLPFLHAHIPFGNLYYRIREIDMDGAYVYSNTCVVAQ